MDNDTTIDDINHPYWLGSSGLAGQPYRDILVVGSQDNGNTWTFPVNISKTAHFEEAFVTTPEVVNGSKFPVFYQGDIEPGTILQNSDIYDADFQNFMIMQQVNVSDIFTYGADTNHLCNQSEVPLGIRDVVSGQLGLIKLYPNPAQDLVHISMKFINTEEQVAIQVIDLTGKINYSTELNHVSELSHAIPVCG
mgnify:FL=1